MGFSGIKSRGGGYHQKKNTQVIFILAGSPEAAHIHPHTWLICRAMAIRCHFKAPQIVGIWAVDISHVDVPGIDFTAGGFYKLIEPSYGFVELAGALMKDELPGDIHCEVFLIRISEIADDVEASPPV